MFCYKCGVENVSNAKFCRVCGADMVAIALTEDKSDAVIGLSEKYAEVYAKGVKGILASIGLLIVTSIAFAVRTEDGYLWLLLMPFFFVYLATGVARFVQAHTIRKMNVRSNASQRPNEMNAGRKEALSPQNETDRFVDARFSVTEHTTNRLKLDDPDEPLTRTSNTR